jgi:flagellum-specific ATP synthase
MKAWGLDRYIDCLKHLPGQRWSGQVVEVLDSVVGSQGPLASVGDTCTIQCSSGSRLGEIIGFRGSLLLSMPLHTAAGIRYGDRVVTCGTRPTVPFSEKMLGHVLDATGAVLDSDHSLPCESVVPIEGRLPGALSRVPIRQPIGCGVRAIDAFLTCGRGQRMGIFGGSGVGKTTLIGMMTRGTAADLTVLALVGERGREVGEFLEALGPAGRQRSVMVVSTSNESPLMRIRAALTATSIAEAFATRGKHVLLVIDSLTRFAMAQREIGLAAKEPPTSKGYTPSVFSRLAQLVERAGEFSTGSITAFYTVLMEGDDQLDPIVDAVRSLIDGHIVLDRQLATANHYPPISLRDSISRLMPAVCSEAHLAKVGAIRSLLALYDRCEDLLRVGAYQPGSDPQLDRAIAILPEINKFLRQRHNEQCSIQDVMQSFSELPQ